MARGLSLPSSNQQRTQIQRPREHRQSAVRIHGPLLLRSIPAEFDAVLIRIAQIQRLADSVVRRAVEGDAGGLKTSQGIAQILALRIEDGCVQEAGGARGGWAAVEAFPGIQADVMMIAARRNEGRLRAEALHQREAEHAAIERQRTLQIRDLEMDMADAGSGGDGGGHGGDSWRAVD